MSKQTQCIDHTGRKFESVYAMCKFWGINQNKFYWRRCAGASVAEALSMKAYVGKRKRP